MWQTDALEMLDILTTLNIRYPRMHDALEFVCAKQTADGRWLLETTYNRNQITLERKSLPGKFLTLRALRILMRFQK